MKTFIRLQLLLLCHLLVITSCTDLHCEFKDDIVWKVYSCNVVKWPDENSKISAIEGRHKTNSTNADVQSLRIENNPNVQYITDDIFTVFENLRYLVVHSTSLRCLQRDDFSHAKNLKDIFMTHNEITALVSSFGGAHMLENLNLRENKIRDVAANAFRGLTSLRYLTLTSNVIDSLHSTTFVDQTLLERLSLSSNKLRHIDVRLFSENRNLRVVYLDNNRLTFISGEIFDNNLKLREIYMENNRIKHIVSGKQFLVNLKDLEVAVFENNECVDIMLLVANRLYPIYGEIFRKCMRNEGDDGRGYGDEARLQ